MFARPWDMRSDDLESQHHEGSRGRTTPNFAEITGSVFSRKLGKPFRNYARSPTTVSGSGFRVRLILGSMNEIHASPNMLGMHRAASHSWGEWLHYMPAPERKHVPFMAQKYQGPVTLTTPGSPQGASPEMRCLSYHARTVCAVMSTF